MTERVTMAVLARRLDETNKIIADHLKECVEERAETRDAVVKLSRSQADLGASLNDFGGGMKAIASEIEAFKKLPMKAVRWLGAIVVGAVVTVLVQNFMLHEDTSHKVDSATSEASQAAAGSRAVVQRLDAAAAGR